MGRRGLRGSRWGGPTSAFESREGLLASVEGGQRGGEPPRFKIIPSLGYVNQLTFPADIGDEEVAHYIG